MRYPKNHKQDTRAKLLEKGRAVVKKAGFDATGVDALMAAVGLTGGAFYGHFGSKAALFEALVEHEMAHSMRLLAGNAEGGADGGSQPDGGPEHIARSLRRYLSTGHANAPESGCALPALGAEIARATPAARAAVERALKEVRRRWSKHLDDPDAAWALLAQCVGAVLLARTVESERTRRDILAASRRFVDLAQPWSRAPLPSTRDVRPSPEVVPPADRDARSTGARPASARTATGSRSRRRRRSGCGR